MHPVWKASLTRLSSLAVIGAMLVQPAMAAPQPELPKDYRSPFSDVTENNWFFPYVSILSRQGIIAGYPDGRFGPNDTVSTGAALVMVLKAAGVAEQAAPPDTHWAAGYAQYALDKGWLTQEETKQLDADLPRLILARLAAQAIGLAPVKGNSPFADVDDGYVTALYQKGVVAGSRNADGALVFNPKNAITRAEVSTIVWQLQPHISFGSYTLGVLPGVPVNSYDYSDFQLNGDRMSYSGGEAALGVDVSYYQGPIDWRKVASDGIDFAMLRVGGRYYGKDSGGMFADTMFRTYAQGALDAGLEVGVYFFSQAITEAEAREEAEFLLNIIKDYNITGPVVFDWENITDSPARTDNLDSATLTAAANAFCQTVEAAGFQPMIYFNRYIAYLLYDLQGIAQYPFWLAHWETGTPDFYYDIGMWQYTDAGSVNGIEGKVDMNIRLKPW